MLEGLLLVVWSSNDGSRVGLVCGSKVFLLRWVGLGWVSRLVGLVEEIRPKDNSDILTTTLLILLVPICSTNTKTHTNTQFDLFATITAKNCPKCDCPVLEVFEFLSAEREHTEINAMYLTKQSFLNAFHGSNSQH